MLRTGHLPIRYKILIAVLVVVTAVVGTITFTMARLFHADKSIYVSDLASVLAQHAAEEGVAVIDGYRDRMGSCARLLDDPAMTETRRTEILRDLIRQMKGLVAVNFYENGMEVATVYDSQTLDDASLTQEDLSQYFWENPLPFDEIVPGRTFIEHAILLGRLPTLTLAVAYPTADSLGSRVVAATLRIEELTTRQSQAFDVFLIDQQGAYLTQRASRPIDPNARLESVPELVSNSAAIVVEYTQDGVEKLGGFARIGTTPFLAVAEIPKATVYFASRELLSSLLTTALVLLCLAALVSMFWSRRLTNSIGRLVEATREIGKGQFGVNVHITSKDEIGTLARSFNEMGGELMAREEALQDAQAQLIQSEKLAAFGQLGAGFAHEIKNPLAGIIGLLQLLQRQTRENKTLTEGLNTVEKEAKRCQGIVANLLKFARQEKVALEPISIKTVVDDAVAIMNHQLAINKVKLNQDVVDDLPKIVGNSNQLQQILMNLIINAQQAMKEGNVDVVAKRTADGGVELKVVDNGPGIPEDIRKRIFEPFFTTKPTGQGTGLGLSVSYGIIQEHQGTIHVESEVGKGTTFVIRLPAYVPGAGTVNKVTPPADPMGMKKAA